MSKVPKFYSEDCPPAKPTKVAKHDSGGAPQASPPACLVTCAAACHWFDSNPWSHDPTLFGWCHFRMEHLVVDSAVCEEFQHGAVPLRQNHEQVPQVQPSTSPAPKERVLNTKGRARAGARIAARLF